MIDTATNLPTPDLPDEYTIRETMRVGRYTLLYAATHGDAAQPVAVKVAKRGGTGLEAAIRTALDTLPAHPHLIGVHETGVLRSGRLYAATALCPGGSLDDAIRRSGRLRPDDAVAIGAMAADALQAAHQRGVPHGDLRPAALLIDTDGETVVSGFGFGLLYRDDRREAVRLAHWSPALLEGGTPSVTDDVYGLAATLTTLINGAPHLLGAAEEGLAALIATALQGRAPELPDDVPADLRGVLAAALSADPGTRPGSARELGEALRDLSRPIVHPAPGGQGAPGSAQATAFGSSSRPSPGSSSGFAPRASEESSAEAGPPAGDVAVPSPAPEPVVPLEEHAPRRTGEGGYRYGLAAAGIILAIAAAALMSIGTRHPAGPAHASPAAPVPRVVTHQAAPVTRLDETEYQPQHLTAQPGPGEVVLTWSLPAGAVSDGAGIIVRESPALSGGGTVALSRQGRGLPSTYVAAPAPAGQQVCFTVGVLVERTDGTVQLIQAGPACAIPR